MNRAWWLHLDTETFLADQHWKKKEAEDTVEREHHHKEIAVLFRLAITSFNSLDRTFIKYLEQLSIDKIEEVLQIDDEPSWMDSIIQYLTDGILSINPSEVKWLWWMALQYILMNRQLYKKSFFFFTKIPEIDGCWLRTLRNSWRDLWKLLEGKSLAYKVLWQEYYWPTMKKDVAEFVRRCEPCQKYANIQYQSVSQLTSIIADGRSHNRESTYLILFFWHPIRKIYSSCHQLLHQIGRS